MAIENMSSQPAAEGIFPHPAPAGQAYYTWAPEGKPIQILLDFDVIDRLSQEIMRGFGSVPKRGAEVGGLLLGEIETSGNAVIAQVHGFAMVPCDYRRGPSYQLTEGDTRLFAETVEKATQSSHGGLRPIGYFRSHTREGMSLTDEDLQLFSNYFPDPTSIMLLVRPFATKVSQAGFFFEENGQIRSDATYLVFPFRRRELGGGAVGSHPQMAAPVEMPAAAPAFAFDPSEPIASPKGPIPIREAKLEAAPLPETDRGPVNITENRRLFGNRDDAPSPFNPAFDMTASARRDITGPSEPAYSTEASQKLKKSWVWLPVSSIFLLLGVLVGFLIAVTIRKPNSAVPLAAYGLSLAVQQQDPDSIHVTWDRGAVPVAIATRGVLHIQDGDFYKAVELKPAELQTGSVIIRNVRNTVTLKLEVFMLDRNSLTEVRVVKSVNSR